MSLRAVPFIADPFITVSNDQQLHLPPYQQGGFSLLEILIATVLGLLLLAIVVQSYLTVKKIYCIENNLSTLSDNIRFADFILWQNIAQAGFAGCRRLTELDLANHLPNRFSATGGIRGYDSIHAPKYLVGKVLPGTDIIVIAKATFEVQPIVNDIEKGTTSFKVRKKLSSRSNCFVLISDCKNADLFEIDEHHRKTLRLRTALQHPYKRKTAEVRYFEEMAFFISDTGRVNEKNRHISSLYFSINGGDKSELIPDVSDMQVHYGVDTNGSNRVDRYLVASEMGDGKLWDRVLSVVINLKIHSGLLVRQKELCIKLRARG